jgi:hypothetical protein
LNTFSRSLNALVDLGPPISVELNFFEQDRLERHQHEHQNVVLGSKCPHERSGKNMPFKTDVGHGSPLQGRTRQKWLNMQDRFQHTSAQRTTQTNEVSSVLRNTIIMFLFQNHLGQILQKNSRLCVASIHFQLYQQIPSCLLLAYSTQFLFSSLYLFCAKTRVSEMLC